MTDLSKLLIFVLCTFSSVAGATLGAEFGGYFTTDQFVAPSAYTETKTFYTFDLMIPFEKRSSFAATFHISQMDHQFSLASATQSFSSLDMGPGIFWAINRSQTLTALLSYNISVKGSYIGATGESAREWTGTSIVGAVGWMPEVREDLFIGFRLNYYAPSYTSQIHNGAGSAISYSRAWIYPTFAISYRP